MGRFLLVIIISLCINNAYAKNDISFEQHITNIKQELSEKGYDSNIINDVFNNNFIISNQVKNSFTNQPEIKQTFDTYVNAKLSQWRISTGHKKYLEHQEFLKQIEEKYDVPGSIVIALWGVETNYGTYPLKHNAIKALVNLSYIHPRQDRRDYFKNELFSAFAVIKKFNFNHHELYGSWAGALGQCQFMPSNVMRYAVDGNQDGKIDIWNDEQDVLASAANFIQHLGWNNNLVSYKQIITPKNFKLFQKREFKTLTEWQQQNVKFKYTLPSINNQQSFKLFAPENQNNNVYLVSKNFDVIKRWNNSDYFAFSVLSLANEIRNYKKD